MTATDNIPISEGYSVSVSNAMLESKMRQLESNGFITTDLKKSMECNGCSRIIPLTSDIIGKYVVCWNCGKKVIIYKPTTERYIRSINYDRIIKRVDELIASTGLPYIYDKFRRCWLVEAKGKTIPVLITAVSYASFVMFCLEGLGSIFIMLDKRKDQSLINSMNSSQFVDFQTIYENPDATTSILENTAEKFEQNPSVELQRRFEGAIAEMTPYQFEEFCTKFLNSVKLKEKEMASFYAYLSRKKDTIINAKIIKMGGPGNPDFTVISLLDYIQSALKPDKYGDAKKYKTTRFGIDQYSIDVHAHSKGKDTLFMLSTNDVQIEVWKDVLDNKVGSHYKYIILDKELILTLMSCLGLESLLADSVVKPAGN